MRTGQLLDGPKEKWKSNMEVVKATIRFLEKTGRLSKQPQGWITLTHEQRQRISFVSKVTL
jgi:hypothetical protein